MPHDNRRQELAWEDDTQQLARQLTIIHSVPAALCSRQLELQCVPTITSNRGSLRISESAGLSRKDGTRLPPFCSLGNQLARASVQLNWGVARWHFPAPDAKNAGKTHHPIRGRGLLTRVL